LFNIHVTESLPQFNYRTETCHILHSKENSKHKFKTQVAQKHYACQTQAYNETQDTPPPIEYYKVQLRTSMYSTALIYDKIVIIDVVIS
jgi:hypothetical protein